MLTEKNPSSRLWRVVLLLVLCVAGAAGLQTAAWVGFIGSDDMEYYLAGRALSHSFWNVPDGFGGMRTAVSMPIALSLRILGDHEWALILPTCLYALATVTVTFLSLARFVALPAAVIPTMLFASLPVMATTSTMAAADIAELFWGVCGFWLAVESLLCGDSRRQSGLMLGSGACIAFAFASRETSAAMIIWLGAGFLLGYGVPRTKYLWSAVGFLGVVLLECMYFAASAGDPFARFRALLATRSHVSRMAVPPFTFDDTGNLRVYDLIDPFIMLVSKHSFGAFYWLLLALLVLAWCWRKRDSQLPVARRQADQLIVPALALGLIWAVFAAFALASMRIHARYYLAPTYFFLVATSFWLYGRLGVQHWRRFSLAAITILVFTSLLGTWVDNRNPRFAERALADAAMRYRETIHTDKATAYVAAAFLHWRGGQPEQIVSTPPAAGALSFHVRSGLGRPAALRREGADDQRSNQVVLERFSTPPLLGGGLGAAMSGSSVVPRAVSSKLTSSRGSAELIRVGPSGDGAATAPN
ncbi:glycosyltransferase family 39 protein [Accumulibacter sp.]|uniref:ArnT family glycosyltransferase n=1 Tax=Accumulibacter sp. TaxID=2053492 RepID=UPI002C495AC0|nr:glycosyltransferase family 39 protein [Accumulibacter sp.]HNE38885.1 glycosyltransferase family 39 protein [Accumulibacter sp.]